MVKTNIMDCLVEEYLLDWIKMNKSFEHDQKIYTDKH